MAARLSGSNPVTVNDVLDGHVGLDVECLDRIYLNGYIPNLQVSGQVVTFLTAFSATRSRPRRSSTRSDSGSVVRSPRLPTPTTLRWCGSPKTTARST